MTPAERIRIATATADDLLKAACNTAEAAAAAPVAIPEPSADEIAAMWTNEYASTADAEWRERVRLFGCGRGFRFEQTASGSRFEPDPDARHYFTPEESELHSESCKPTPEPRRLILPASTVHLSDDGETMTVVAGRPGTFRPYGNAGPTVEVSRIGGETDG